MNPDTDNRITTEHRSREAVVYVRQSSPDQVRSNVESRRIQLGLREKAIALGWSRPTVIDEDLGISAGGYAHRPGFQQLLAKVALREIGIILCVDASRLSRNSKDWAHLFELCSYFGTLIADLEQIYDLSRPNDRLVLGIKGTVSEMELSILRTRLRGGLEAKAARGELRINIPTGYSYNASEQIDLDPDRRVQRAIAAMFDQFDNCTSTRQLAMWYRDTNTRFPINVIGKGAVTRWQIPTVKTLHKLLIHPIYAGAYVYGRRVTRVEYIDGKLVKRTGAYLPFDQCRVCIRDHHPAYISWERLLANMSKIAENRPRWNMRENRGAIRDGLAMLAGLLRCGHCGCRIYVSYKAANALYYCDGGHVQGAQRCLTFGSHRVDRSVGEELCRAVAPLSIEAAIAATEQIEQQRGQEIETAEMQLQAAEYEADKAFEQFDLVNPRNRLVADTLEERLNVKLAELQDAKGRVAQARQAHEALTEDQRRQLHELAGDFPSVWNHPDADGPLKKSLLRAAIHEVIVTQTEPKLLDVTIHWQGGVHTRIDVKRHARPKGSKTEPALIDLVRRLAAELSDGEIARILNMKQIETPRALRWTQDRVTNFRRQHKIRGPRARPANTLTQNEAAEHLGIGRGGLLGLVRLGAISKNQITEFAPWRVSKEELDSEGVKELVTHLKKTGRFPRGGCSNDQPSLFNAK